jgi:hypothetical protein
VQRVARTIAIIGLRLAHQKKTICILFGHRLEDQQACGFAKPTQQLSTSQFTETGGEMSGIYRHESQE